MDFDDLDEAANADPRPGVYEPREYFPPIPRNFRMPDFNSVPERLQKVGGYENLHLEAKPKVTMRAFVFYGAGDTWYAWAHLAKNAPAFCEVAVHEWPFHGSRDEEDPITTLDAMTNDAFRGMKTAMEQHAKGGRIEGAPFALIGHSIGCLVVVGLAKKLFEEMGLSPACVIMLDRAAPHFPLHSEFGQKLRDEDPWQFMKDYNAMVWQAATGAGGEKGERMIKMWCDDVTIGSDTRPVDWFRFENPLMLCIALENFGIEAQKDHPDPKVREMHAIRDKLMGSPPGCAMDCDADQYKAWSEWVEEPKLLIVKEIKASHITIKSNQTCLDAIWELLEKHKAPSPP
mmetsp:Transcript_96062/g.213900  ORF Transcript_96062/g.213900 Transcript_96062/m.213900 type:complete len:344 (-) Transcript_96062:37-1068(-)